jgi:hypothetical protein
MGRESTARARWAASLLASGLAWLGCGGSPGSHAASNDSGATAQGGACSAAIAQALMPVDMTSMGAVSILSDSAGVRTVFIDAHAGGAPNSAGFPYVYVNLATASRVDLTDVSARTSTAWDLAFKRYVIFTNDGDAGPGQGGAKSVGSQFDAVTAADAQGLATESFFDAQCTVKADQFGGLLTTFSDWYSYDQATNRLTPQAVTYVVRGGTGSLYKLAIDTYYASANGTMGIASGYFLIRVAAL